MSVILFDAAVDYAREATSDLSTRCNLRIAFVDGAEWQWKRVAEIGEEVIGLRATLAKIASEKTIGEPFESESRILSRDEIIEISRAALKVQP